MWAYAEAPARWSNRSHKVPVSDTKLPDFV
jgi:hypothetical protein